METRIIIILAFVLAFGGLAQAQTTYIILEEDFEGLTLGPSPEEAPGAQGVWTDTPPPGWIVDDSGVPGVGDPATDGMADWAGWAFTDKQWWIIEAGNQRRSEYTLGQGTVAVADPDEWDDASHPDGSYNAWFSTPAIDISDSGAGTIQLKFDSSWRPDSPQMAVINLQYDGGDAIEILRWESDAGAYFKDDYSTNETIVIDLDNPAGAQSAVISFGLLNCGNDWWWAIDNIMVTGTPKLELAWYLRPANRESDVCNKVVLKWTPGAYAPPVNGHRVFFSQDFDDVNDGAAAADRGLTSDPEFDTAALPFTIDYETTYYWRIDEANTVTGWDEGPVWQFTTDPIAYALGPADITATASSSEAGRGPENTINESGLDGDLHSIDTPAMWLSTSGGPEPAWIQYEFDRAYKLYEMWVWNYNGEGLLTFYGPNEVTIEYSTDGDTWTELSGVGEFAQAPGSNGYAHDTPVAFGGAAAKYVKITANSNHSKGMADQYGLSEVRFFYLPVRPRWPSPEDEATGVAIDVTLSWSAGREAETHELYFSDDEQAVTDGSVSPVILPAGGCGSSYGPLSLDLGTTYYWKVVEVNNAEEPNTWEGDVWSFSTPEYILVEDFEGYSDDPGDEVFATWPDGYGVDANGSQIGYLDTPYLEQTIVHGGSWSAPLHYNNTGTVVNSEVTRTFDSPQDWTVRGIRVLTLFFYGQAGNTTPSAGEQMYVELNGGVKVPYDGDMADITQEQWHEWDIDLASFGVNLQNVTTISIGFDRGASSASGLVYFDDIRLYPPQCILSRRSVDFAKADYVKDCIIDCKEVAVMAENWLLTAADPGTGNLVGWWKFDGNADDSSVSGIHGTAWGNPQYVSGQINSAMQFDGNTHVVLGTAFDLNFGDTTDFSVALWANTTGWQNDAALISNKDWDSGSYTGWVIAGQGGGDGSWQWNYCGETGGRRDYDPSGPELSDGEWHHLCVSHDRDGYANFYFDGEYQARRDISGSTGTIDATYPTVIGTDGAEGLVWAYWFEGAIDDVRIYNTVLTDEQVLSLSGIRGDLNEDDKVDFKDFAGLGELWLVEDLWP